MVGIKVWKWLYGLGITFFSTYLFTNSSVAQIRPDATLPNNSNVTIDGSTNMISGGTTVGANLFHSFSEFSVPAGVEAFFNNAQGIQNILTRVTGTKTSDINGLVRASGKANLFLINPNGITFGQNATLNIGGSFVATTANAIEFGNGKFFSASNPEPPSPLLTINPSAFLFNQIAAPIQNNSISPAGRDLAGFQALGLRVGDGKSLLLVGGDVNMNGGQLNAYSGRVELGGLASKGTVGIEVNGDNLSLSFPENMTRSNVSVTNKAKVYVEGNGSGSIAINARNIDILGSLLSAGIGQGLGNSETVAGDITLNATEEIKVTDSNVSNIVRTLALGNGGNLTINTGLLLVQDGAFLSTGIYGAGKGGNLDVTANSIEVIGRSSSGTFSSLSAQANPGSTGNAGNLRVNTGSLLIRDGAFVSNGTFGAGKGGNLDVTANSIEVIGRSSSLSSQANRDITGDAGNLTINTGSLMVRDEAFVSTNTFGTGKGGNLTINTDSLLIRDGGQVATRAFGKGKGGNLDVTAQTVEVIGRSANGQFYSGLFADTNKNATGDAGNLTINTGSLSIRDGAQVLARNNGGRGNAGSVTINASDTVYIEALKGNGEPTIGTDVTNEGVGNGNDINIKARSIVLNNDAVIAASIIDGKGEDGKFAQAGNVNITADNQVLLNNGGRIYSEIGSNSVGNGGTINITAPSVLLENSSYLITRIKKGGQGNAGNVKISTSDSVLFARSGILSTAEADAIGSGGNIDINTASLTLKDGAQVLARNNGGRGNAGSVTINASDTVYIEALKGNAQATIGSDVTNGGVGNGNDINIKARSVVLNNDAVVAASILNGKGEDSKFAQAGNVNITADNQVFLNNGGRIFSEVGSTSVGNGGTINITAPSVSLNEAFLITRIKEGGQGQAGDINITTGTLDALAGTQVLASTSFQGNAGNVRINASDSVLFADAYIFSRVGAGAIGFGGNIDINAASLSFKDGAQVSANTSGEGSAGNIQLKGTQSISISGNGSMISAETRSRSTGGNLTVNTGKLTVQDGAQVSVSSAGSGKAGALTVNANSIKLDNQGKIRADTRGGGGNIFLNSPLLLLRRDSSITTNASGNNITGGNINIDNQNGFIIAVPSENSDIRADSADFRGGNVTIKNIAGIFGIQARKEPSLNTSDISAKGATPDLSGNIQITPPDTDPSSGLIELPVNLVDASNQISNACTPGSRQFDSTFTATGRSGLPISPTEPLQDQSISSAWVRFNETKPENSTTVRINQPSLVAAAPTIIEASGWIADKSGNIELVAPGSKTPQQLHSVSCHALH